MLFGRWIWPGPRPAEPVTKPKATGVDVSGVLAGGSLFTFTQQTGQGLETRQPVKCKRGLSRSRQSSGRGDSPEVTFELRPEVKRHVDIWGKSGPGRESSVCKGPEVGTGSVCWTHQEVDEVGWNCCRAGT